jgi:hypothetical protein
MAEALAKAGIVKEEQLLSLKKKVKAARKKVLYIGAIESRYDNGEFKKYSWTFVNNALTYKKDHPHEDVYIIDCRDHVDAPNPIESMMAEVDVVGPVYRLIISSHSDWESLYIFSQTRKELDGSARFLSETFNWKRFWLTVDGEIRLDGCQTAGRAGVELEKCIAQTIADETGRNVYGFVSRSSQLKRKDGGFEQRAPGGYRLVSPTTRISYDI